jgi:hypothetical protein
LVFPRSKTVDFRLLDGGSWSGIKKLAMPGIRGAEKFRAVKEIKRTKQSADKSNYYEGDIRPLRLAQVNCYEPIHEAFSLDWLVVKLGVIELDACHCWGGVILRGRERLGEIDLGHWIVPEPAVLGQHRHNFQSINYSFCSGYCF